MRAVISLTSALVLAAGAVACGASSPDAAGSSGSITLAASTTTATAGGTAPLPAIPPLRPAKVLAAQITQAEATLASPASAADAVRQAGEFEQLADRMLAEARTPLRSRVLSHLSGRALAITTADVAAASGLRSITPPEPTLPPWRIVAPLPARQLMRLYRSAQRQTGVPWTYLAAVNFVETKFGRIVGPSDAGAQGPMQFMPATWASYGGGGDVHDPRDAIPAAARYLRAHGAPRDMRAALYAYNHSTSYVNAVTAYAKVMKRWPRSFLGYRAWRVLYRARSGVWVLPVGYPTTKATRISAE